MDDLKRTHRRGQGIAAGLLGLAALARFMGKADAFDVVVYLVLALLGCGYALFTSLLVFAFGKTVRAVSVIHAGVAFSLVVAILIFGG